MRKTSAKTLSLALSLLLVISVLFSLSLPVWAETEAVHGDLNGDTLVDANDVTILEAVLGGSQAGAAGVNYDISGNKMVDSEDLTVLKNMVNPEEPALADKLNGSTTEDLIPLVTSVNGGSVQSAIVFGDSTRALELNGGTITVLFAEAQDWSGKATLEMDTLWLSGSNRAVNVVLLGADGKTILGAPDEVTAEKAGWSPISVSLTGILAKVREKVGGIMITVADDAHLYVDNLALTAAKVEEEDDGVLTRAEMENALVEMAWNWYFKDPAYQYDSASLNSIEQHMCNPLAGYAGGKSRLTLFPTLEDATSHSNVFTVCSGFAYDLYKTALGYPILGAKYNSLTMTFWRNSSYYPGYDRDAKGAYDMTVLRWHSVGQGSIYDNYDTEFSNYYKDENGNIVFNNWYDKQAVIDFFNEKDENGYPKNFRPGDIIVSDRPGHTVIYIGNGMVMDVNGSKTILDTLVASGGGKYVMENITDTAGNITTPAGTDRPELAGCVSYRTFDDYFLTKQTTDDDHKFYINRLTNYPSVRSGDADGNGTVEKGETITVHNSIVVLRPLNLLTLKDDNDDPSDDKLNPDYVLNTGLLKYQLKHDTTHEVKTSGYGIDETTATRLQYPVMNIDRTVNITPYGTAAKGDTITYSVKITNNSNDTNYANFRQASGDTGYAGEEYKDLWVVEHIPANTELVAVPTNATRVGDTLRWNIDVPAGQTVTLSYEVKVTGEIGDTIVSGGGWVNNIPSNTIVNIIGGKKLSTDHQDAISNNGIDGITTATGTDLAEQIYKNADLKLDLPSVQKLMNIFFSEYTYETPYGYYLYYGSSGIKRYMYKLNAQADILQNKLYYDMLVPGYYGGLWCYTDEYNGEPRINELRTEYLEVGDILVYMDLSDLTLTFTENGQVKKNDGRLYEERELAGYTVLVYLGDDTFAAVDQDGALSTRFDALAYTEAFSHDLFVCLRPSQVYADLNAEIPTYTITWEVAEDETYTVDVPYGVVPTFEGTEPTKDGYTFAGWTPLVRPATEDITYKPVFKTYRDLSGQKLTDSELDALAAITPEMVQEAFAYYALTSSNIQVTIPWIYEQAGITVPSQLSTNKIYATRNLLFDSKNGLAVNASIAAPYTKMLVTNAYGGSLMTTVPTFDIGYLQIGDIFCAAFDQADTPALKTVYYSYLYQGNGKFLSMDADAAVCDWEEVLNKKYANTDCGWSYYFVIRPENCNTTNRDITLRSLTDAEAYALSKLTYGIDNQHIQNTVPAFYKAVGINITMMRNANNQISTEYVRNWLFKNDSSRAPMAATEDEWTRFYHKMAVPAYGGSWVPPRLTVANTVANGVLQTGDVILGAYHSHSYENDAGKTVNVRPYITALYQGGDKFLLIYGWYAEKTATGVVEIINMEEATAADIDALKPVYFYTLRPENLAAETQETYTVTWLNDDGTELKTEEVTAYTLPDFGETDPVKTDAQYNYTFAGWTPLTTSVNRDVTYTATYTQAEERTYTVIWNNADGTELEKDENVPYGTMPSYNGATPTKDADTQYSYTFAGWDKEFSEVTGDVTYTAVYDAYRFLTVHDLNDAELNALASITPEDVKAAIDSDELAGTNLDAAAPWIYKQAHIDASAELSAYTVYGLRWQLLTSTGVYPTTKNPAYCPMLVTNAYGFPKNGTSYLDLDYLQVGDLFCGSYLGMGADKESAHFVYLYQGNGKFLLMNEDSDIYYWQDIKNKTYTYEGQKYDWDYYYVIRPENYNGDRVRDINLRELTEAEEYRLSLLTGEDISFPTRNLHGTLPEFFKAVGITVDMQGLTHVDGRNKQFASATGGRVLRVATDDTMCFVQKMMVPCYGGDQLAEKITIKAAFANKVFKIGDVVAGACRDIQTVASNGSVSNSPFTALYQGDGMFLMVYPEVNPDNTADNIIHKVQMSAGEIDDIDFLYYYTLRPENLATVSNDDTFTVTWVNEDGTVLETDENVALYAHPSYDSDVVPTKAADAQYTYTFAGWTPVKSAVNSDITYTAAYSNTVNTYTVTWVDANGTTLETDENVEYGTVPTYDGRRPYDKTNALGWNGWDSEISAVTGDVTYTATYTDLRDMTSGDLTDAEKAIISNLTVADWSSNTGKLDLKYILPWVYKEAGIDVTAHGYQERTNINLANLFAGRNQVAKDYYYKLLVAGSYGTDVSGLGTDSLQIGDIFAAAYTWVFEDSTDGGYMYYVAIYQGKDDQGNDKFLVAYDKEGYLDGTNFKRYNDTAIMTSDQLLASMQTNAVWAYRYILRPSQLATIPCTVTWKNADGSVLRTDLVPYGSTPSYDGTPTMTREGYTYTFEGWDKEIAVATGDATYTATYSYVRDLTAHKLTNAELNDLAAITPEDVAASLTGTNLKTVGAWTYQQANITYSADAHGLLDVYWMLRELFSGSKEDRIDDGIDKEVYYWTVNSSIAPPYTTMLVPNAYGGTQVENAPVFDLDYLQVGDFYCAAFDKEQTGASSTSYVVYLYQGKGENGEGKFLLMNKSSAAIYTWEEVRDRKYNDTDVGWSYFYVIRPENYNGATRDIALRNLTDAEKYELANLAKFSGLNSGLMYKYVRDIYGKVNISLDLKSQNSDTAFALLFTPVTGTSYYTPIAPSTDAKTQYYQTMLVDGYYGGTYFESSVALSEDTLEIGDVFVGFDEYNAKSKGWSGVYQGEGNFLMYYWNSAGKGTWGVVNISALDPSNFYYYFILRPDNLAN